MITVVCHIYFIVMSKSLFLLSRFWHCIFQLNTPKILHIILHLLISSSSSMTVCHHHHAQPHMGDNHQRTFKHDSHLYLTPDPLYQSSLNIIFTSPAVIYLTSQIIQLVLLHYLTWQRNGWNRIKKINQQIQI